MPAATQERFHEFSAAVSNRATASFRENGAHVSRDFYRRGFHGYYSEHAAALCRAAAEAFTEAAAETYGALLQVYEGAPGPTVQAIEEAASLLDSQLVVLGDAVSQALNGRIKPMIATASNQALIAPAPAEFQELIVTKRNELKAKIRMDLSRAGLAGVQGTWVHVGDNANNVAVVTGNSAPASVTQTANGAEREQLKAAADALIAVIQAASSTPAKNQKELIDLLQEVKTEADKPSPSKLKISGALGATDGAVSMIANGPAAYANLMAAWDALKAMLS